MIASSTAYADSDGVKIHYASLGEGPLVVMIHGFPDFWYTWREQVDALSSDFKVVAIDTRGYNKSDKPEGVASHAMPLLVGDVAAVIRHLGRDKAIIVGHDWGGIRGVAIRSQRARNDLPARHLELAAPERPHARAAHEPTAI